jgi:hypothetical protein
VPAAAEETAAMAEGASPMVSFIVKAGDEDKEGEEEEEDEREGEAEWTAFAAGRLLIGCE